MSVFIYLWGVLSLYVVGAGAAALAEAVVRATDAPSEFKLLYDVTAPIEDKIETIVKEIYRGDGIELSERAQADIARYKAQGNCGGGGQSDSNE